jgi:hypothetical protein
MRDMLSDDLPMSSFSEPLPEEIVQPEARAFKADVVLPDDNVVVPIGPPGQMTDEVRTLRNELKAAKALSEVMAADVKRLMKERRLPRTDPELRDALAEGAARTKRLQEENRALLEQIEKKDAETKLLQAQLSRLKAA